MRRHRRASEGSPPGTPLLLRDPSVTLPEAAEQLGHSVATLSEHYAHVIAELNGQPPMAADDQVNLARAERARRASGPLGDD